MTNGQNIATNEANCLEGSVGPIATSHSVSVQTAAHLEAATHMDDNHD